MRCLEEYRKQWRPNHRKLGWEKQKEEEKEKRREGVEEERRKKEKAKKERTIEVKRLAEK